MASAIRKFLEEGFLDQEEEERFLQDYSGLKASSLLPETSLNPNRTAVTLLERASPLLQDSQRLGLDQGWPLLLHLASSRILVQSLPQTPSPRTI